MEIPGNYLWIEDIDRNKTSRYKDAAIARLNKGINHSNSIQSKLTIF
jgi:hypothetical protein